ncbi:hypothetical protein ACDZ29_28050 (plasmid) [Peribacillus sp. RS7]|uniref:hypothetical protein n=1 Tax=Peribacillus sp. RS7 TaxID=3242679 RepID=UPI0035BF19B5
MSNIITSGPFAVPLFIDGTSNLPVDRLLIGLKNPTDETKTVRVTVERLPDVVFPTTAPETAIPGFNQLQVSLPSEHFTIIRIDAGPATFQGGNWLRVTIEGDTDEEAEGIEVALFGGNDGRPTVSMIFKHEDFIEVDED